MRFENMNFGKIFAILMKTLAEQENVKISYELKKKPETEEEKTAS